MAKNKIDTRQIEVRQQMGGMPCDGPDGGGECHHRNACEEVGFLLFGIGRGSWNCCPGCMRDAVTERVEELVKECGKGVKI